MFKVAFFDKLTSKTCFKNVTQFEPELKKIAFVRIFAGLILFIRWSQILNSLIIFNESPHIISLISCFVILIFFLIIGFCTPISTLLVTYGQFYLDEKIGTMTLGTFVASMLLVVLLLTQSGSFYSVDRWIYSKKSIFSRILRGIYSIGPRNCNDISRAYFLGFLLYAAISFTALIFHLMDEYWIRGLTLKSLFTSSWQSNFYIFFRFLDLKAPLLFSTLSISGGLSQSLYQLSMFPAVFSKIGSKLIFYWGLLFFLLSLFCINLGALPHTEILLWLLLFVPIRAKKPLTVIYDDACRLCNRTLRLLKFFNFNESLAFQPLSGSQEKCISLGLDIKNVKANMHGYKESNVFHGYNLYSQIAKSNWLYWPLTPIFLLGKWTKLGPRIYNSVAAKRDLNALVCPVASSNSHLTDTDVLPRTNKSKVSSSILSLYYYFYLSATLLFLIYQIPFCNLTTISKGKVRYRPWMRKLHWSIGLVSPNVFNKTDLSSGNNWAEIYCEDGDGWEIVPMVGKEGQRLSYQKDPFLFANHGSDFLYFATTLKFRREILELHDQSDIDNFLTKGYGFENLSKRVRYDYNKQKYRGMKKYRIQVYRTNASTVYHKSAPQERFSKKLLRDSIYQYGKDGLVEIGSLTNN